MGSEGDLVQGRFLRGCRCFAVVLDGGVAGYGWLSTGPEWIGELQLVIRPRKAEGYIWNCATLGPHRQKGIFRSLLAGISEAARHTGMKRVWIGTVAIPAEKALAPSGFRPAVHASYVVVARWHLMRISYERSALGRDGLHVLSTGPGLWLGTVKRRRH